MNVEPARAHKKEGKTGSGRERGSRKRKQRGKVGERGWLGAPAFQGSRGVAREAAAHLQVPTAPGQRGKPLSKTDLGYRSLQIKHRQAYWGSLSSAAQVPKTLPSLEGLTEGSRRALPK